MEYKSNETRLSSSSIQRDSIEPTRSHENESLTARNTLTPTGIPHDPRSSQNAQKCPQKPSFDEARLWANHADLLASLPDEQSRQAVKLGIISEYVLQGIRTKKNIETLLLLASLGISIANNDRPFFDNVRKELGR